MNNVLETAYKDILAYAGLASNSNGGISLAGDDELLRTKGGKELYLPYNDNLRSVKGKQICHILNENWLKPESECFEIYKDSLISEINMKTALVMNFLIDLSCNIPLQKKIKDKKLRDFMMEISGLSSETGGGSVLGESEFEPVMGETLVNKVLVKAVKERGKGAFLDVFVTRNGEVDGVDYQVTGKVNFVLYRELKKALEEKEYKLYGHTVRKRDVIVYMNILNAMFVNIEDTNFWSTGVDNTVFGHLNCLLTTTLLIVNRLNEIIDMLSEDLGLSDTMEEIRFNTDWLDSIEKVLDNPEIIKAIPNQDDVVADGKRKPKLNTEKVASMPTPNMQQVKQAMQQSPQQQPQQPPQQQQQAPQQMSLEERLSMGTVNPVQQQQPMYQQQQPMYQPQQMQQPLMQQPMQMQGQPQPSWMRQYQQPQQQQMYQQPMYQPQQMQQQMYQQAMPQQAPGWLRQMEQSNNPPQGYNPMGQYNQGHNFYNGPMMGNTMMNGGVY